MVLIVKGPDRVRRSNAEFRQTGRVPFLLLCCAPTIYAVRWSCEINCFADVRMGHFEAASMSASSESFQRMGFHACCDSLPVQTGFRNKVLEISQGEILTDTDNEPPLL
jgi:hypothetical protein